MIRPLLLLLLLIMILLLLLLLLLLQHLLLLLLLLLLLSIIKLMKPIKLINNQSRNGDVFLVLAGPVAWALVGSIGVGAARRES